MDMSTQEKEPLYSRAPEHDWGASHGAVTPWYWMTGISDGLLSIEGGMMAINHVFRRGVVYT